MPLTDTRSRAQKTTGSRYEVSDDGCIGLYVRVGEKETKTFVYKYRRNGRLQRLTLGRYPYLTLHDARAQATELTRRRNLGEDIRKKPQEESTVNDLVVQYIAHLKRRGKKTWGEDQRIFDRDVLPHFGDRKADSISKRELISMLDEIAIGRNAGYMANRTLSCIRSFFRWAACEDLISVDPSSGIRKRVREHSRERSLSESEIRQLWSDLCNSPLSTEMRIALKLILLTGKRTTEIIHGRWSEIDNGWWVTPQEKSKTGVMNRTPILSLSQALIDDLRLLSRHSVWLFPSPWREEPVRVDSVCRAVCRLRQSLAMPHWTSRDLRRTAATHMGRLGVPDHVIGKIMNHVDGRVTGIYNRHGYDDEKYDALLRWDNEVIRILGNKYEAAQAA
jgi:integrase